MRIAKQKTDKRETEVESTFGGYDRSGETPENSFFDMKNMTGESYPHISVREERGLMNSNGARIFDIMCLDIKLGSDIVKNALVADCENRIKAFYTENGKPASADLFNTSSLLTQKEKKWVISGTRIYFFPDNVYYDMMNGTAGSLAVHTSYALGPQNGAFIELSFTPCDREGNEADELSPYRKVERISYKLLETGEKGEMIKKLSFTNAVISGDTVSLRGLELPELNRDYNVVCRPVGGSALVVEAAEIYAQSSGTVYLDRSIPEMDYVVAAKNRLWGCRYGEDAYGRCVNEIYASAVGDPCNWNRFQGASTDSWFSSVSSPGAFTGAVCMDGNPVFFKEDAIIKVFGDHPSDFSVTEIQQRGIENGSSKSACFVNGDLYYRAHSGIVRYDGGVPQNVDRALGGEGESYKNAVAGSRGDLYYVSMEDKSGERVLFVYDTVRKTWHKEDTKSIKSFCRCGKDLYFLCEEKGESRVYSVLPKEGFEAESRVHWMCESGRLGYALQNKKYVSSVYLRLDCPVGSYADVLMEYDSDGVWHRKASVAGSEGSRLIRLRPHRCDHFRIRIEGEGRCSISSVARTLESCSGH